MIDRTVANELAQQIKDLKKALEKNVKTKSFRKSMKEFGQNKDIMAPMFEEIARNIKKSQRFNLLTEKHIIKMTEDAITTSQKESRKLAESMKKNIDGITNFLKGELSQILGEAEGIFKFIKDVSMLILKPFMKFTWSKLLVPLGRLMKSGAEKMIDKVFRREKKGTKKDPQLKELSNIRIMFGNFNNMMKKLFTKLERSFTNNKYDSKINSRLFGQGEEADGFGLGDAAMMGASQALMSKFLKKGGKFAKGLLKKGGLLALGADAIFGGMEEGGVKGVVKGGLFGGKKGGALNAGENAYKWGTIGALVGSLAGPVGTIVGGAVGGVLGGISGWFGGDMIEKLAIDAGKFLQNLFTSIGKWAEEMWNKIIEYGNIAAGAIADVYKNLKESVVSLYEKQKEWWRDLYNTSSTFFKDLIDITDKDWGSKLKTNAGDFFDKVTEMFKSLLNLIPGGPLMARGIGMGANAASNMMFGNPSAGLNTGQNLIANPGGSVAAIPQQYIELIKKSAAASGFSPALIAGLIQQESNWNPNAVSPKGARGLGQFMPGTASALGIDPNNPEQAIMGIGRYLKDVKETLERKGMANPSLEHILAGYNAGPGNVLKHGGIPPFKETQGYVKNVLRNTAQYGGTGSGGMAGMANDALGAASAWVGQAYNSVSGALQNAVNNVMNSQYVRGGKNPMQGLDCSGAADFMMVSTLQAFNGQMADAYKKSVAGVAAGKAQRIAQTFGVPLMTPDQMTAEGLRGMGEGTVLSWTAPKGNWYTGHNAMVTKDASGQLVVSEMGGKSSKGNQTSLEEWVERNKGKYYAANPLMAAAGMPSPAGNIQQMSVMGISNEAQHQNMMYQAMEDIRKQQKEIPKAVTNVASMVNNTRSGSEGASSRQVLTPPENIMEGQYSLFVMNSTYNE